MEISGINIRSPYIPITRILNFDWLYTAYVYWSKLSKLIMLNVQFFSVENVYEYELIPIPKIMT